jgi:hypothetical protein
MQLFRSLQLYNDQHSVSVIRPQTRHNHPKTTSVVQIRSPEAAGCLLPHSKWQHFNPIPARLDLCIRKTWLLQYHTRTRLCLPMLSIECVRSFKANHTQIVLLDVAKPSQQSKPMPTFSQVNHLNGLALNLRSGYMVRKVRANWLFRLDLYVRDAACLLPEGGRPGRDDIFVVAEDKITAHPA